ncbi:hypothetical protein L873DRAFT_1785594 [Choiromyces venosus 120613-1]|uniref:Uncharacterized protein n=1 Tax=Choiromyces venosus 120613-1 TaxID=1336337 RepID=A0A3N4K498_9PEZI|nr:hypothetical protein L873DRAFT_1785594 [Choiromyces venosus 120613-1]
MPPILPILVYPLLYAYATWALWTLSAENGLFPAIGKVIHSGFFPDDTPLMQKYTGHEYTDGWLLTLVTFPVTRELEDGTIEYVQNTFAQVVIGYTAMLASAYRSKSNFLLWWPSIWGLAFQAFGGGIVLSLYSLVSAHFPPSGQPSAKAAAAIPWSILIGAILPAFISLTPELLPRGELTHQIILAIWQPFPAYVSIVQALLTYTPLSALVPKPKNISKYLGNIFVALAVAAGTLHFATNVYNWKNLRGTHVPHLHEAELWDAAKSFSVRDSICIHITLLGFAVVKGRSLWAVGLAPVIGPGAVAAWWLAEGEFAAVEGGEKLGSRTAGKGKKEVAS